MWIVLVAVKAEVDTAYSCSVQEDYELSVILMKKNDAGMARRGETVAKAKGSLGFHIPSFIRRWT